MRGVHTLMAITAGTLLGMFALFAAAGSMANAASQPASTYSSDRTAYDHAVAVGTPDSYRHFIIAYPDSPLAQTAIAELVQICSQVKAPPQPIYDDACNLSTLTKKLGISNNDSPFADPPPEHSFRDRASDH